MKVRTKRQTVSAGYLSEALTRKLEISGYKIVKNHPFSSPTFIDTRIYDETGRNRIGIPFLAFNSEENIVILDSVRNLSIMYPNAFNSLYERVWSESEVSTFETGDTEEFLAVELEEMTMENILQILTILKPSTEEMFDQDLLEEYRLIRTSIQKGSLTVPVINLTLS